MAATNLTVPILIDWKDIEEHMAQHDIVEVVRCKDCVFFENENPCGIVDWWNGPDDFCSKGRRRE